MITYTQGDLLGACTAALVNPVNTVGVMGKGLALQFKQRFTDNYRRYVAACQAGEVRIGVMFVTPGPGGDGPRWIVNFPTQQHWQAPSQLAWVRAGLQDLRRFLLTHPVRSIALPALGAGLGGLARPAVRQEIEALLGDLEIDIRVCTSGAGP